MTVTIVLRGGAGSPTPELPVYMCGAWATNSTPIYTINTVEGVYAKFVRTVDGNPEGVGGATAVATVLWPDGTEESIDAVTSGDGLAVFAIDVTQNISAIGGVTLVTVSFYKDGGPSCLVDGTRAAYFTVVMPTPTSIPTPTPSSKATPGGTPMPILTPTP